MKINMRKTLVLLMGICLFFQGCSAKETFKEIEPGSIYHGPIEIKEPQPLNTITIGDESFLIDLSNTDDGYIMVRTLHPFEKRLKLRLMHEDQQYTYDLIANEQYTVFPLQMGNGEYSIAIYQNTEGTSYAQVFAGQFDVQCEPNEVFTFPNQLVWYTHEYPAILLSFDICQDIENDEEKVEAIYEYIVNYMSYDSEKAANVQSGYIPNLTEVLNEKKGICFDYAALMAAMLRAQNIPSRLVMGNLASEGIYHAWNEVCINKEWRWYDATYGPENSNKLSDYVDDRRY